MFTNQSLRAHATGQQRRAGTASAVGNRAIAESLEKRVMLAYVNVRVNDPTQDPDPLNWNTQNETATAVFTAPGAALPTVVTSFNDWGAKRVSDRKHGVGFTSSTDGGALFADSGALLPTGNIGDNGDSVLAVDNLGNGGNPTVYMAALSQWDPYRYPVISRSANGGASFDSFSFAFGDLGLGVKLDKPWIAVDNYAGSSRGYVYLAAFNTASASTLPGSMVFTRSTDAGNTWGGSVVLAEGADDRYFQGANIVVAPDHSIYAFYLRNIGNVEENGPFNTTLEYRRSTTFGASFDEPVTVGALQSTLGSGDLGLTGTGTFDGTAQTFRTNGFPMVAANPANPNQLFVAYADDPDGAQGPDRADIFMVWTNNATAATPTWSSPIRINDDATTNDQWQPTIAMKPDGSQLFIGWYDRRNDPNNELIDVYGRVADLNSNGPTFGNDFKISSQSFPSYFNEDPNVIRKYMGDYDQAAADNSGFYYSWGDNRDASPQDPTSPNNQGPNVYFQRIPSISGTPSDDSIIVRLDPSNSSLIETLVNGSVTYRDVLAGGTTITIDGVGGNDTVSIQGGLSPDLVLYAGTAPSDQMTLTGGGTTSNVEVARGTVTFSGPRDVASLHVDSGAHLSVSPVAGGNNILFTPSLKIDGDGTLDLTDNKMVIDYTGPVGTLVDDTRVLLSNGRIITSATASAPTRLGYADNAILGLSSFGGHPVDASSLLVKFTYEGDANLDGQVDVSDLGALATNWQTNAPWTGGDFDYSGFVDVSDLGMLATDWQAGVGNPLNPQRPSGGGGDGDMFGGADDGGFLTIVQDLGLSDQELSDLLNVLGSNAGAPLL